MARDTLLSRVRISADLQLPCTSSQWTAIAIEPKALTHARSMLFPRPLGVWENLSVDENLLSHPHAKCQASGGGAVFERG